MNCLNRNTYLLEWIAILVYDIVTVVVDAAIYNLRGYTIKILRKPEEETKLLTNQSHTN
jgi:hypothetical protein